jgi:hypothetical protein
MLQIRFSIAVMLLLLAAMLVSPSALRATTICDPIPGNLVQNCGFEGGVYTSTVGGFTNTNVPVDWTANAAFDEFTSFNQRTTAIVNSGSFALSIGDLETEPVPQLSQTFSDSLGVTYNGSLFVDYGGNGGGNNTTAFFNTLIDNVPVVTLNNTAPGTYTQYSFSFIGTGSDTITLQGNTNPSEWFVDDITVTSSVSSPVPEPGTLALFGTGILSLAGMIRRKGLWARS